MFLEENAISDATYINRDYYDEETMMKNKGEERCLGIIKEKTTYKSLIHE